MDKLKFSTSPTYYEILEISDENASIEQIKKQYQKLLLLVSLLTLLHHNIARIGL